MNVIPYTGPADFDSLRDAARTASVDNPGKRIIIVAHGFSSYNLHLLARITGAARSLASNSGPLSDGYFLNGTWKTWTTAQIAADQKDWR